MEANFTLDPTRDLRTRTMGPEAESWEDIEIHLRYHGPPELPVSVVGNTSGLDCLIQVVRHTNRLLAEYVRIPEEDENPILAYAWQDLDFSELRGDFDDDFRGKMWLIRQLRSHVGSLDFATLCGSRLMNETLWSLPEWTLSTLYFVPTGDRQMDLLELQSREEIGRRGLLHFDCSGEQQQSLQEFANGVFDPPDEFADVPVYSRPLFVRVEYTANATNPQPFQEMKTFDMPVIHEDRNRRQYRPPTRSEHYVLVAIVRHPGNGFSDCMVRTYRTDGEPVCLVARAESYTSTGWRLSDTGGVTYTLFYVRSHTRPLHDTAELVGARFVLPAEDNCRPS